MDDDPIDNLAEESADSSRGPGLFGVVLAVLVAYVLSPGVVVMIFGDSGPPSSMEWFFQPFFAPLEWLYDKVDLVESFYDFLFELMSR